MARRIPIFPLSNVVLFPGCLVPLHVFEDRYRQMTAAALEGERTIGMTTVRPDHADDMAGDPPLFDVGCAGVIERHELLPDGRYNLLLRGTKRFRIENEIPLRGERLYRVAEVTDLEEPPGAVERNAALRSGVLQHLRTLAQRGGTLDESAFTRLEQLEDGEFANTISQAVGLSPEEKQGLLEAHDIAQRLDTLEGLLAFHAATPSGAPPATVH